MTDSPAANLTCSLCGASFGPTEYHSCPTATAALRDWPCTNADHLGLCSDSHVHADHVAASSACPCGADHCEVCGALDWRLERVGGREPYLWCGRCGEPEGTAKDADCST